MQNSPMSDMTASPAQGSRFAAAPKHTDFKQDRLFDVAQRATAAALCLYDGVDAPSARVVRSRKAVRAFAGYARVIAEAKGRPHGAAEQLLFGVAENTLKTLTQVYTVWSSRPMARPFSLVEKQAFDILVRSATPGEVVSCLPDQDPDKAVETVRARIETLGGDVAALIEAVGASSTTSVDREAFEQVAAEMLRRAGGGLSLTEAAQRLKVTRQRVHKRIQDGTVLGMALTDGTLVVPAFQIDKRDGAETVLSGLDLAIRPFIAAGEGGWSALQWILDPDPNLGMSPLEALQAGRSNDVARAARAYVGIDEG